MLEDRRGKQATAASYNARSLVRWRRRRPGQRTARAPKDKPKSCHEVVQRLLMLTLRQRRVVSDE